MFFILGGLNDHPDQLEFMYRLRSYILGRNEGCLSFDGNTLNDTTPDLEEVTSLSTTFFKALVPTTTENSSDDIIKELNSLEYDGLEHLAGYICKRIKDSDLYESKEAPPKSYTWTDQLSEGFLKKPTENLMKEMQKLEHIFNSSNGEKILFQKNFLDDLINKAQNVECSEKVKRLFFRSRMYFRLRDLNKKMKDDNLSRKRKLKKIIN